MNNCTYSDISKEYLGKTVKQFFRKAEQYEQVRLMYFEIPSEGRLLPPVFFESPRYLTKHFQVIR